MNFPAFKLLTVVVTVTFAFSANGQEIMPGSAEDLGPLKPPTVAATQAATPSAAQEEKKPATVGEDLADLLGRKVTIAAVRAEIENCLAVSKGTKTMEQCERQVTRMALIANGGTNPDEAACKELSKSYGEELGKLRLGCPNGDSTCTSKLRSCQEKLESIGGKSGNAQQVIQAYSQAYQGLQTTDKFCAQTLVARDQEFIQKERERAQDDITSLTESANTLKTSILESKSANSQALKDLRSSTLDTVEDLLESANVEIEIMLRTSDKISKDFKATAKQFARRINQVNEEIRKNVEDLPRMAELDYAVAVAKIASECTAKGREEAEKRRQDKEALKALNRLGVKTVGEIFASQNKKDPKVRYLAKKIYHEKLCMQDREKELAALKQKKDDQKKLFEARSNELAKEIAMLEIELQDLVDEAKTEEERNIAEKMRQKERKVARADMLQDTYSSRSRELQMEAQQKGELLNQQLQEIEQKKYLANMTLGSLPQDTGNNDDYKDFREAIRASMALGTYSDDVTTCCDKNKLIYGGTGNFCGEGRTSAEAFRKGNRSNR